MNCSQKKKIKMRNPPSGVFVTCKAVEAPSTTRVPVKTPIVEKATLVSLRLCVCGTKKGESNKKSGENERGLIMYVLQK